MLKSVEVNVETETSVGELEERHNNGQLLVVGGVGGEGTKRAHQ